MGEGPEALPRYSGSSMLESGRWMEEAEYAKLGIKCYHRIGSLGSLTDKDHPLHQRRQMDFQPSLYQSTPNLVLALEPPVNCCSN